MLRKAIVTAQGLADPAVRKSIVQDSAIGFCQSNFVFWLWGISFAKFLFWSKNQSPEFVSQKCVCESPEATYPKCGIELDPIFFACLVILFVPAIQHS